MSSAVDSAVSSRPGADDLVGRARDCPHGPDFDRTSRRSSGRISDAFCEVYAREGRADQRTGEHGEVLRQEFVDMWIEERPRAESPRGHLGLDTAIRGDGSRRTGCRGHLPRLRYPLRALQQVVAALNNYRLTHEQGSARTRLSTDGWSISAPPHPIASPAWRWCRFDDVDAAMTEIRWAKEAGLKGMLPPEFQLLVPGVPPRFDPIWSLLEDLEMPVNSHSAITARSTSACYRARQRPLSHSAAASPHVIGGSDHPEARVLLRCTRSWCTSSGAGSWSTTRISSSCSPRRARPGWPARLRNMDYT